MNDDGNTPESISLGQRSTSPHGHRSATVFADEDYARKRGDDQLKERYMRPELIEYGRIEALTLGQNGNSPDSVALGGQLINNICDPSLPHPGLSCS